MSTYYYEYLLKCRTYETYLLPHYETCLFRAYSYTGTDETWQLLLCAPLTYVRAAVTDDPWPQLPLVRVAPLPMTRTSCAGNPWPLCGLPVAAVTDDPHLLCGLHRWPVAAVTSYYVMHLLLMCVPRPNYLSSSPLCVLRRRA